MRNTQLIVGLLLMASVVWFVMFLAFGPLIATAVIVLLAIFEDVCPRNGRHQ